MSLFAIPVVSRRNEDARRAAADKLPDYSEELAHFHRAFAPELQSLIASLPVGPQMRVLDVACGDGFYLRLFAERLTSPGEVVGLDANPKCLERARQRLARRRWSCEIDFIEGTLERLPFPEASFDFVWCAQSLFTLPEPVTALRQMAEAVRPGGLLAVLENDTLHQLLLPWPNHLELALRTAEFQALSDRPGRGEKYYIGRRLPAVFAAAGLEPINLRTQVIDRQVPFDPHLEAFLEAYLARLGQRVAPYLDRPLACELCELIDRQNPASLFRQPFVSLTWLNMLQLARRPF